jgi:vacuolar-type H+-ATPase subunit H
VSDVIQRLLEVEKEARGILTDAEQQAAATLSKANEQARAVRADGREQSRQHADKFVAEKTEELNRQYEVRLEEAKAGLPTARSLDADEVQKAARFVVGVISGQASDSER